ncbi:hypothetical protein [Megalodesulfovibrio gigas]|uniref:hypothetical protein n=1 Tax=Megalodesulfovibrio gigas TaxID=879 RepID=UPI001930A806|nr:hypothetical protein [Megalodesulfovibrio gigas]
MTPCIALLDANVLYPAPMRDLLLQLAVDDLFRAKGSSAAAQSALFRARLSRHPVASRTYQADRKSKRFWNVSLMKAHIFHTIIYIFRLNF